MAGNGLISVESRFRVGETIDRLVETVTSAGLRVFARIDHAAGAREVGAALRPTELLIFGHPKGGTPLMQDRQLAGIDLPIKALAWEDEQGKVWLSYNDAHWLAERHDLGDASRDAVVAIAAGMKKVVAAAAGVDQS
ncbi:Protein CrcB homolog 1 (fragment) [Mesorhizobium plurifarium]|uniref:Protein CrcB homolog 1 n=1 Tax=Mesorhizobium plurifarium TaxID=69974 RepID=A0A090F5U2_MESPL